MMSIEYAGFNLIKDSHTKSLLKGQEDRARNVGHPEMPTEFNEENKIRYDKINYYSRIIKNRLTKSNKKRLRNTFSLRSRRKGEPIGIHTEGWVPHDLVDYVYLSHAAYVLPRLLIDYIEVDNKKTKRNIHIESQRLSQGLDIFNQIAEKAKNETELAISFAERLADIKDEGDNEINRIILSRLLSKSKFEQDNLKSDYLNAIKLLNKNGPLWRCYENMCKEQDNRIYIDKT
jgi:hypothetical protein